MNAEIFQATAIIVAARIQARAASSANQGTTLAAMQTPLKDQFVQTYRELEAAATAIASEEATSGAI